MKAARRVRQYGESRDTEPARRSAATNPPCPRATDDTPRAAAAGASASTLRSESARPTTTRRHYAERGTPRRCEGPRCEPPRAQRPPSSLARPSSSSSAPVAPPFATWPDSTRAARAARRLGPRPRATGRRPRRGFAHASPGATLARAPRSAGRRSAAPATGRRQRRAARPDSLCQRALTRLVATRPTRAPSENAKHGARYGARR